MNLLETCRLVLLNLIENKFKVFLTSLGILVGTITIVLVIAIGKGGEAKVADQFKDLSAETVYVNLNYKRLENKEMSQIEKLNMNIVEQIKEESTTLEDLYLSASSYMEVKLGNEKVYTSITGVSDGFDKVSNLEIDEGLQLDEEDQEYENNVAVIGKNIVEKYYGSSENAINQTIQIGNNTYKIIGTLKGKGDGLQGLNPDDTIFLPYAVANKFMDTNTITRGRSKTSFKEETMKILSNCKVNEYCLVSIDIVKFNAINDAFGIEEGNKILKYVYETIALNLSENECVARIESDVFDILMRNDGKEHIEKRLQEIVTQINRFNEMASIKYYISFACGIYCIEDPEMQLIKIQDRANLARKKLKNDIDAEFCQCRFYNTQDTLELIREKDIENKMRLALENHEFELYLQPKFNLFTNKVDASEALIRWIGSEEIYPEEFIPLFERNGFIVELDYYVFEEVCKTIRKWLDNGVSFDTISFNMSRYNLANNDKLSRYEMLRNKYNIPSSYLEFEITESLIIESETVITRFIDNAKALGYQCSIDDFGSGYSSLNVLKTIHADALKIDKEFFSEKGGKREETIIEFIIKLAHELGMKTIAEGVETKDQVDYLKTLGCDMIQGFYYSKPIIVSEFERLYL